MKKAFCIAICIFILFLTGCGNSIKVGNNSIKSGYYSNESQLTLLSIKDDNKFIFSRNTMMSYAPSGTYKVVGDKLEMYDEQGKKCEFSFEIIGNKLIYHGDTVEKYIVDGDALTYIENEDLTQS